MQARPTLKTMRLPLNTRVDEDLARDIEKQSVYVSEHLRKLTIKAHPSEVEITYDDGCDIDELCSKVSRFTASMVRGHRKIEPTIHHQRTRTEKRPYVEDVFGKLKERRWLFEHGQGVVSLAGPALSLFTLVDAAFKQAYEDRVLAHHAAVPSDGQLPPAGAVRLLRDASERAELRFPPGERFR